MIGYGCIKSINYSFNYLIGWIQSESFTLSNSNCVIRGKMNLTKNRKENTFKNKYFVPTGNVYSHFNQHYGYSKDIFLSF